jgi:hypothetical protein
MGGGSGDVENENLDLALIISEKPEFQRIKGKPERKEYQPIAKHLRTWRKSSLSTTFMTEAPSLPVELLADIAKYLAPHTPTIGHDAVWTHPDSLLNWWDKYYQTPIPMNGGRIPLTNTLWSGAVPYASLLALRQ